MSNPAIARCQRAALAHPVPLGAAHPIEPTTLVFPTPSGRRFEGRLTVDVDFPGGPSWHLCLMRPQLDWDRGMAGIDDLCPIETVADRELTHLIHMMLDSVGTGAIETSGSPDLSIIHASRALSRGELRRIGKSRRRH